MNLAAPDIQYKGKNAKPIPPDYELGELGPSEWWFEFWRDTRTRDQKRAASLNKPKGVT